ncbi:MAG TPA: hypothetical protein VK995_06240 [Oceanipulchritudo sp.]|nr:hypothetical protein [Oceanipulchritudo sp.]
MTVHLHWKRILLTCLIPCLAMTSLTASADQDGSDDKTWQAILEEADTASEWADDPIADLELFSLKPDPLFLTTSLAAGAGHSSNFLKRPVAVGSPYLRAEGSLFLDWTLKNSSLSAMAFVEATFYEEDTTASDEYLAYAQLDWSRPVKDLEPGIMLETYYADQIYDASLVSSNVPVGTHVRQFRPQAAAYLDWFVGQQDRLRLETAALRADYDVDQEDYWEPILALEWERLWKKSLTSESRIEFSRQFYDEEVARNAQGTPLPGLIPLEVDRIAFDERIIWNPKGRKWLQAQLTGGVAWEIDRVGQFESMRQTWISASLKTSFKWGHLRVIGRWSEFNYDERQVSYFDPTTQLLNQRGIRLEVKKKLPWNLALYLRANWSRLDSREEDEAYTDRRLEGLLEWSY